MRKWVDVDNFLGPLKSTQTGISLFMKPLSEAGR